MKSLKNYSIVWPLLTTDNIVKGTLHRSATQCCTIGWFRRFANTIPDLTEEERSDIAYELELAFKEHNKIQGYVSVWNDSSFTQLNEIATKINEFGEHLGFLKKEENEINKTLKKD